MRRVVAEANVRGRDLGRLKPLVMGGIVTSTLLTLLVLPVLYEALERRSFAAQDAALTS